MFCLGGVGVVVVSSYLVRILLSLLSILLICLCKWSKTKSIAKLFFFHYFVNFRHSESYPTRCREYNVRPFGVRILFMFRDNVPQIKQN